MTSEEYRKLKIGDRLIFHMTYTPGIRIPATVIKFDETMNGWVVRLDQYHPYGHTCEGLVEHGFGRWVYEPDLEDWSLEPTLKEKLKTLWSGALT